MIRHLGGSPSLIYVHCLLFTGGNDVFLDIGDKSWGVLACQRFFGGIDGSKTLHVGDQFLSAGANDFKVSALLIHRIHDVLCYFSYRSLPPRIVLSGMTGGYLKSLTHLQTRQACTTAWIASPAETVALLDEMAALEEQQARKEK
jgi:IMP and pyridine-specific 5'-nucleotidase